MKALLEKVNLETGELITLEGKVYLVNPGDLPTCCTWTPTAELEIDTRKGYITNLDCGVTIQII
jgi:hypothetical protein